MTATAAAPVSDTIGVRAGRLTNAGRRLWLLPCKHVGRRVHVTGPVLIRGRGSVLIGDDVILDASMAPIELNAAERAVIEIGAGARIGSGVQLEALERIEVGEGAVIGAHATVIDSHMHSTSGDRRAQTPPIPVRIGAGGRIGPRAILVPGAELGAGSELLADSMLTRRVPAGVVLGGVPARPVQGRP